MYRTNMTVETSRKTISSYKSFQKSVNSQRIIYKSGSTLPFSNRFNKFIKINTFTYYLATIIKADAV